VAFFFYHKPHPSNLELITYCLERYEGVDNVLECFYGFCSVVNLSHANNVFNIINICHNKLGRTITRSLGKVTIMLRVNVAPLKPVWSQIQASERPESSKVTI